MHLCLRTVTTLALVLSPCWANVDHLKQMLVSALNDQVPTIDERQVMLAAHDLKPDELRSLLPLGMQCLQSSHQTGRSAGLALFRVAEESPSGSVLLEPYISDFADCLKVSQCFYQRWAVSMLLTTTNPPRPSETAAAVLVSNLEDETDNFNDDIVVGSLLQSFPSDLSMRRRILNVVQQRSDSGVTGTAVGALRKVDRLAPEDLAFIRSCLADDNPWVLAATIDLLAEIDSSVREQFMERIKAMAAEPQPTDVRTALDRFFEHISPKHDSNPSKP